MSAKRSWTGRAAAAAMAVGLALATSAAMAAPAVEQVDSVIVPSAKSLLKFYPSALSSTPAGVVEDQDVWLAKVQGLMAGAPSLLQQSILMSQSKQEFSSNVMLLQQVQKGSFDQGVVAVKSLAKDGKFGAKSLDANSPLGNGNGDLVYTALQPCRIMDTRNAAGASGVQGPLSGNTLYHIPGFITAGSNWSLYGQTAPLSDCGLNSNVGGNIWAVALVITIPAEGGRPNFDAFLGVSDTNNLATVLTKVALNFTHLQGISTLYIVPQTILGNQIYFAMPAGLSANVIFDVVGFFAVSEATALDCVAGTPTTLVAGAGTSQSLNSGACPSGYTKASVACRLSGFDTGRYATIGLNSGGADCQWTDSGGGSTMNATATCCRLPGR